MNKSLTTIALFMLLFGSLKLLKPMREEKSESVDFLTC